MMAAEGRLGSPSSSAGSSPFQLVVAFVLQLYVVVGLVEKPDRPVNLVSLAEFADGLEDLLGGNVGPDAKLALSDPRVGQC